MYLICGLGNPGKEYEATRHNLGFIAVDVLSSRFEIKADRLRFRALTGEGRIGDEKIIIAKPQTFMNLSGEAVRPLADYYKIPSDKIIIVYDDADLPPGALRIRPHGGSGTHNGMRSVIYQLGTENFPRIRIGTGSSELIPLEKFVLGKWTEAERPILAEAVQKAAEACETIVRTGLDDAMNKYNTRLSIDVKDF